MARYFFLPPFLTLPPCLPWLSLPLSFPVLLCVSLPPLVIVKPSCSCSVTLLYVNEGRRGANCWPRLGVKALKSCCGWMPIDTTWLIIACVQSKGNLLPEQIKSLYFGKDSMPQQGSRLRCGYKFKLGVEPDLA